MTVAEETLGFIAEWYDPRPQILKTFHLKFSPSTHQIEIKTPPSPQHPTASLFLKRTPLPSTILKSDFCVGGVVNLFGRMMTIVGYTDYYTEDLMNVSDERHCCILPYAIERDWGRIIEGFERRGVKIGECKSLILNTNESRALVNMLDDVNTQYDVNELSQPGQKSLYVTFRGPNCAQILANFITFKTNTHIHNLIASTKSTATYTNSSLLIIKPHLLKSPGVVGQILQHLDRENYDVSCLQTFTLQKSTAEEFFAAYKGNPYYTDFPAFVKEMCSGPLLAIEVSSAGNTVLNLRKTCGPWDIEMANNLYPNSIRGKYVPLVKQGEEGDGKGGNVVRNGVWCTDLEGEGEKDCEYFFGLLN